MRRAGRMLFPVVWAAVCLAAMPSGAGAKPAPSVDELREQLAALQREPPPGIPRGTFETVAYNIDVAERITPRFETQSQLWRSRAAEFLARIRQGVDPLPEQRGQILMRGYRSPLSTFLQGYAIYIPPGYDPARPYPLMIVLHGGSANGNLFLAVVLGNNMSWKAYSNHLWDLYQPRWSPDWIVIAPDGFGQVMWRWMGERDVLDAIEDVQRHYNVDPLRIVLGGLSNGGVGAYSIGLRHAWRFSVVTAMAGAPSWLQYAGGRISEAEAVSMRPLSGLHLAENAFNTDFRYFHGRQDTGPMKPWFVEKFSALIGELGVAHRETWYDTGHDILYLVHRHGRIYGQLADIRRDPRPAEVRVVTGDYRANRQHWLTVTRIADYPKLARVRAVVQGRSITVETSNALGFSLDLRSAPLADGPDRPPKTTSPAVRISVDGSAVYEGAREPLGHVLHVVKGASGWQLGFPSSTPGRLQKQPGSSGPISDAYYGAMVHVYGTANPDHTDALRRAAEKGASGWPLWLWRYQQQVLPDTEVTDAMMRERHLVLYATSGDNRVLERMGDKLPIRVRAEGVVLGGRVISGEHVGVRFIHPNPLAPQRYVVVQAGMTPQAVAAGNRLPDFLPDYVVYDERVARTRPRLVFGSGRKPLAFGYFDRFWQLPPAETQASGRGQPATKAVEGTRRLGRKAPPSGRSQPATNAVEGARLPRLEGGARLPRLEGGDDFPQPQPLVRDSAPEALPAGSDAADAAVEPLLPIPPAPPSPQPPANLGVSPRDPAGLAARRIVQRVQGFENYRARTPGGRWVVDPLATWSVRRQAMCLRKMQKSGIRGRAWAPPLPTPVPTPVELTGRILGVWFRIAHEERPVLISCELATRLPALARVLKRQGVRGVDLMSAYRDRPRSSFHTMGLALDLMRFWTRGSAITVSRDFVQTPAHPTCEAPKPNTAGGRALLAIACDLAETKQFSTILTPNYNVGHRDHFHIDARPYDPRIFVR